MKQRLGLAGALLGDPAHLILDEPVNGLDPEGVSWMRRTIRALAAEGRSVLVSSHLLSEMQLTADRLVVIGKGRMIGEYSMEEFLAGGSPRRGRDRGCPGRAGAGHGARERRVHRRLPRRDARRGSAGRPGGGPAGTAAHRGDPGRGL
jgi:ABC-type multidrug transport system ATPase subunit